MDAMTPLVVLMVITGAAWWGAVVAMIIIVGIEKLKDKFRPGL